MYVYNSNCITSKTVTHIYDSIAVCERYVRINYKFYTQTRRSNLLHIIRATKGASMYF